MPPECGRNSAKEKTGRGVGAYYCSSLYIHWNLSDAAVIP